MHSSVTSLPADKLQVAKDTIVFFVNQRLLASCQHCSRCGSDMKVAETIRVNDGYIWPDKRCRTLFRVSTQNSILQMTGGNKPRHLFICF